MRSSWTALRRGFARKFSTRHARAAIESLARRHPELARFDTPESVIAHCHGSPIEVADRVIARLTRCVQQGDHVDFASTALWLALWPGLTGIFDRRIRHFDRQPRELVSSLALAFSRNVHGLNHASVRHVACALVRGTERDLMSERQLEWSRTKHWSTHTGLDEETGWPSTRILDTAPAEARLISARLGSIGDAVFGVAGSDADVVISVAILGESQREASLRLGISHDAARKRFQRAVARLRSELSEPVSQFA